MLFTSSSSEPAEPLQLVRVYAIASINVTVTLRAALPLFAFAIANGGAQFLGPYAVVSDDGDLSVT